MKFKKIIKYATLITFLLLAVSIFINLLFQGTIYNYYVDLANSCDVENNFWNIAKNYKQIGVIFSNVGNVLFWILLLLIIFCIIIYFCDFIKAKKK